MDEYVSSLQPFQFMADLHLPDVMAFTPGTLLINHNLAADRRIILMDKVSIGHIYMHSTIWDHCISKRNLR